MEVRSMEERVKKIGHVIRLKRMAKRMDQKEFASLVGCSKEHLSHIEIGEARVGLKTLFAIADTLDCHISELFSEIPETVKN
jgi:transcriptional regulator with XRE-family HTH domain